MSAVDTIKKAFDIRREERGLAGLMFLYFFLVITSFWILKPIKKTLFIGHYADNGMSLFGNMLSAPEAEQLAKVSNMFVAMIAVVVFSALSRQLRREQLTYVFTVFFFVAYLLFGFVDPSGSGAGVWSFYLFGDLFSTLMVATFFSFLNDSVSSDAAKRLYGVVGFGGVLGGVFGSTAVALWIGTLSFQRWMLVAAGIAVAIVLIARGAAQSLAKQSAGIQVEAVEAEQKIHKAASDVGNPATAGAKLVFRSGYLLSIVAIVGLYELVSTLIDFQFTSAVVHFTEDAVSRNQHFASVYAATNWVSMLVQLFLTSFVMRRFGLGVALVLLPASIAMASLGFLAAPSLMLGSLLLVSDNGLSYSINQSSKEALYVPTTVEEKYQAKAFIDMFVQRFAKAIGVGLGLVISQSIVGFAGISSLSFAVLPIAAVWSYAAIYAGRRFKRLEDESAAS